MRSVTIAQTQIPDPDAPKRVTCKKCGFPMYADHGIIHMNTDGGVTWWQCENPLCNRRVEEEYELQNNIIVTINATEV